jgi:hypothetical protein
MYIGMYPLDHANALADKPPVSTQWRPEWVRIPEATRTFGLSRSKLYELIAERRIKSFCLRERNKIKGVRLINYDSLSDYLQRHAREQEKEAVA